MTIVDIHTHVYPGKIAEKASEAIGEFYHVPMYAPGSSEALLAACAEAGIDRQVVYSVATKASQVEKINDFVAEQCAANPSFLGFATMQQDYPDPEPEIRRAKGMGLLGIKMHPDTQGVNLDDDRLMKVYEVAEKLGMPVVLHCGDYRYDYSHPRRLVHVLHEFPNLRVNGAHFGGWSIPDLAVEYLEHENCYMDLSSSMAYLGPRRTRELIGIYGADRIMYGSDFPMWNPAGEVAKVRELGLTPLELEKVLHRNAEAFLERDLA